MIVRFERTFDYQLVRSIVTHPKIYRPSLVADGYPAREDFRVAEDERLWYVLALDQQATLGVFVFAPENERVWDAHMAMLPHAWGQSEAICQALFQWLRISTTCRVLKAAVPEYNRLMLRLAHRLGMDVFDSEPHSISQRGVLYGRTIFSLPL